MPAPHVVVLAATKGGVGKTTLATCLAVRASQDSKRVALVDLDPQRSLQGWYERRGDKHCDNPALFRGPDLLPDAIDALNATGWDWAIVDTPPAGLDLLRHNLTAADVVLIPVKTSAYDLEAVAPVVDICRELGKPFAIVLNDVDNRSTMARSAVDLLRELEIPVVPFKNDKGEPVPGIAHRVAYAACATVGKSAAEIEAGKAKDERRATEEIEQLFKHVRALLGLRRR